MFLRLTLSALVLSACSGCAVVAVGDAVVTTASATATTAQPLQAARTSADKVIRRNMGQSRK